MRILYLMLLLTVLISCKEETASKKCNYVGMTWIDLDDAQKAEIVNAKGVSQNLKLVLDEKSFIVEGTREKEMLFEELKSPDCNEFPLYSHFVNLILGDSILIYSDERKLYHRAATNQLGSIVISLFENYPEEMFTYISQSPEHNYRFSGALIAGFYEESFHMKGKPDSPEELSGQFFDRLKKAIDFENSDRQQLYMNFKMDIDTELWGMLQESN